MSSQQSTVNSQQPADRPILFQTEMVKAILEGRKTQTRRHIKGQPTGDDAINLKDVFNHNPEYFYEICKYGKPGDLLWVREKFTPLPFDMVNQRTGLHFSYFADCDAESLEIAKEYGFKWKPSIHMPKSASRIWLMIEDIRVERVQEISEGDAINEGVNLATILQGYVSWQSHRAGFLDLWISINGEESWNANPWVWMIQFRVLSTTGKPSDEVIQTNFTEVRNG